MSWYRAGTVSLTNGSGTVTGSGTAFIANASIGEGFLGPDGRVYEIANVASDTSLTITPAYLGSTASGQAYAIAPLRGLDRQNLALLNDLITNYAGIANGIGAGLFPNGTVSQPAMRAAADQDTGVFFPASNSLGLVTGGSERVRVTSTGAVGIGTTTPAQLLHVNGNALLGGSPAAQWSGVTAASDVAIQSDAPLLNFVNAAGNTRFGFINHEGATGNLNILSTTASGNFVVWTNNTARLVIEASGTVRPGVDGTQFLGTGALRWGTIFSSTGTINTSDAREKVWRGGLDEAAVRAANRIIGELGFFQWKDAVDEKGEDGARIHFGARAQEVARIMIEEGLEAEQKLDFAPGKFIPAKSRPSFRNAFLCFDTWEDEYEDEIAEVEVPFAVETDLFDADGNPVTRTETRIETVKTGEKVLARKAGNRFGLRIDQLTMFLLAALASRVAALEAAK